MHSLLLSMFIVDFDKLCALSFHCLITDGLSVYHSLTVTPRPTVAAVSVSCQINKKCFRCRLSVVKSTNEMSRTRPVLVNSQS